MQTKTNGTVTAPDEVEIPVHLSHDHVTDDEDDYIDRMAMDSFPASDPPSFSPTAVGAPSRENPREAPRSRSRQSAPGVAVLRGIGSIASSTFRIVKASCMRLLSSFAS